jgi:signal peptidase I
MKPWMRWTLWIIGILAVVFGVMRYLFVDFWTVPDDVTDLHNWSNAPSLEPGDFTLLWRIGSPHIGDLVRCPDPSADPKGSKWMVGRVAALPGDRILIGEGAIKLNGFNIVGTGCHELPRKVMDVNGAETELKCSGEELGSSKHDIYTREGSNTYAEVTVPAGQIFLLSDNRTQPWSHDSREPEVGTIPIETCKETVMIRLWSKKGWSDGPRRMSFLF